MKILYFGIYDSNYSRNKVLIKGLRKNGVEVIQCQVKPGFGWQFRLLFKYLKMWPKFDVMVVGFPGQEVMILARLITGRLVIFDAFTSHYGGYILDRQYYAQNSLRAKYYRWIDRASCRLADRVLLDTNAHIEFFVKQFGLPRAKFSRIFVGTDSSVFFPCFRLENKGTFLVHFHGNFIPLQGVEYIVRAAKLLEGKNIRFQLVGSGQTYARSRALAQELNISNIRWLEPVPYEKLAELMAPADICLGIFGDTPKVPLVIPNKIFEAVAMAKLVITADTPAIRELFQDSENIILCKAADPENLSDKILKLRQDNDLRQRVGKSGQELFKNRLTEGILGKELMDIANSLHK